MTATWRAPGPTGLGAAQLALRAGMVGSIRSHGLCSLARLAVAWVQVRSNGFGAVYQPTGSECPLDLVVFCLASRCCGIRRDSDSLGSHRRYSCIVLAAEHSCWCTDDSLPCVGDVCLRAHVVSVAAQYGLAMSAASGRLTNRWSARGGIKCQAQSSARAPLSSTVRSFMFSVQLEPVFGTSWHQGDTT